MIYAENTPNRLIRGKKHSGKRVNKNFVLHRLRSRVIDTVDDGVLVAGYPKNVETIESIFPCNCCYTNSSSKDSILSCVKYLLSKIMGAPCNKILSVTVVDVEANGQCGQTKRQCYCILPTYHGTWPHSHSPNVNYSK